MSKKGSGPPPIQATSKPTPPPLSTDGDEGETLTSSDATLTDIEPDMDYLLSSAAPNGPSDPYASTEGGWSVGPQDVDPFSSMAGPSGPMTPYTGWNDDPYTNISAEGANSNAYTVGQDVDPYAQSQSLEDLWKAMGANSIDTSQWLASNNNEGAAATPAPANDDAETAKLIAQTWQEFVQTAAVYTIGGNTYSTDSSGNVWISDSNGNLQFFAIPFASGGGYYIEPPDSSTRNLVFTQPMDIGVNPPAVTTSTDAASPLANPTPTDSPTTSLPAPPPDPPTPPPFPTAPSSNTPQPSGSPTSQGAQAATFGEGVTAFGEGAAEGAVIGLSLFALGTFGSAIGVGMLGYGAYKLATGGYKDVLATANRIGANEGTADDYKALGGIVGGIFSGRIAGMAEDGAAGQGFLSYFERSTQAANDVKPIRRLPIVDPHFTSSITPADAFQGLADSVAGRLRANPKLVADMHLLSAGEQRLAAKGPWAKRITFGNAVERGMEAAARPTGLLQHTGDIRPMQLGGADFLGTPETPFEGLKFQVTTPGQYLRNHLVNGDEGTIFGLHWGPD